MTRIDTAAVIAAKRDGRPLEGHQIASLVAGYCDGTVTDAQAAAFAMAVCWRGLDDDELVALCDAMIASGERLEWRCERPVVDKHSTGGVGDKISIVLAPLLATLGCAVPMLSGRGLGHTGGTLDKLEAIPGFQSALSPQDAQRILADVGCFIAGAGSALVPADARLYALRDHTGTVASPHLIATSIISKKIAGGAGTLVVDVKYGSGAFCGTLEAAETLAELMGRLAARAGVAYDAAYSPMDAPLGLAVGNACEIDEARAVLDGGGPADVAELTVDLAWRICTLAGMGLGHDQVAGVLASGAARETFDAMVAAQGGDPDAPLPRGAHHAVVAAPGDGYVHFDAAGIGAAAWTAGAGRSRPGGPVDPAAGIRLLVGDGARVHHGDELAVVEGTDRDAVDAAARRCGHATAVDATPRATRELRWWSAQ